MTQGKKVGAPTVVDEKRFCAAEGDSGDADSVGRANGLPALASSSKERTCVEEGFRWSPESDMCWNSPDSQDKYQILRFRH